ncbi:Translation factor guf1 mitochondrial [Monosporozyma unispora]|nr:Translation factor guf1 mitochondrial [Kazachstania unispora]
MIRLSLIFRRFASISIQQRLDKIPLKDYRIFSIAAHIDHGKSTLSDRLLEITNVIDKHNNNKQILDKLEVERERGITIKAQTCSMFYENTKTHEYLLQLIDTPGHVDFKDEVVRSFASVDGVILLVDAIKGVQAQTVANFKLAQEMNLTMVPVINKVDVKNSQVDVVQDQLVHDLGFPEESIVRISAKSGLNIKEQLLPKIIEAIPSPNGEIDSPFRALLIDSWYDPYLGVVLLTKIVDGKVKVGDKIMSGQTKKRYDVKEIGIMYPNQTPLDHLSCGQVGYIIPGMKNIQDAILGDTLISQSHAKNTVLLPVFKEPKPMVFVGAFPADGLDFKALDENINKLVLNDRSVSLNRETSDALGQGWRLGFLGSLHASVFKERLEKEYGSKLIITQPTVPYLVQYEGREPKMITNPSQFPDSSSKHRTKLKSLQEPFVKTTITLPNEYVGPVIQLCENNRGQQLDVNYTTSIDQVELVYDLPLAQLIDDFFGQLKSISHGFATLDYESNGFKESDIVKLELLVNGQSLDALSHVVHRSQVQHLGREWVKKFKEYIRLQQYEVIIQSRCNGKMIARETIKARRKDVLAKLHASDVSRRKKLLAKQKEGKKNLKSVGNVTISQDAYQAFLRK